VTTTPLFWVGDRNPSISEQITINGSPVDLTGAAVQFRMRALRSSVLKVDQPAVIVTPAQGQVRYDWATVDLNTPGQYLVWWVVTLAGKAQDVAEAIIEVRAHAPSTPPAYIELEQLKSSLELTGQTYADADIALAINAASRGIDSATGRRFYLDADANQIRYYSPTSVRRLEIDDLSVFTSLAIDRSGSGSYTETWTNGADFVLEPFNAVADYRPFESVVVRRLSGRWLPWYVEKAVQLTGQFGWAVIPEDVKTATSILAAKLIRRVREAPFGIVTAGGIDQAVAMRIARTDPDVYSLIQSYSRHAPFA
jgi:hypothetical protein